MFAFLETYLHTTKEVSKGLGRKYFQVIFTSAISETIRVVSQNVFCIHAGGVFGSRPKLDEKLLWLCVLQIAIEQSLREN